MASFADQIKAAQSAHLGVHSLDLAARAAIAQAFSDWENNVLDAQTVRHKLEAIVRAAYRSSVAVAAQLTASQAGLVGWTPQTTVKTSDYLTLLIADVRRNLRDYKASGKTDADRRRALSRIQHSAGVGAERGYTDQLIEGYKELEDFGYELEKTWIANFVNNVPCKYCRARHATSVGLHDDFPDDGQKIYHNLQGPPAHPRCSCVLVILIKTLENSFDSIDPEDHPVVPSEMSTDEVKSIPQKVFDAVTKALKTVRKIFRRKKNGK